VSIEHRPKTADLTLLLLARFAFASSLVVTAIAATACGSASTTEAAAKMKPEYNESGRLTRLTYDRNGDGKIDTWGYMDGSRVLRIEVDDNGDGQIDRWEYHTDPKGSAGSNGSDGSKGSRGSDGSKGSDGSTGSTGSTGSIGSIGSSSGDAGDVTLERIDRATKFDGKISRREYFEHGALTRIEEDTDGDGKIDKWETYSAGTLATLAIDTKARGTPDRRLIYQPDGTLSRIETDPSGTGTWRPLPQ
jgi:hypothetical protein